MPEHSLEKKIVLSGGTTKMKGFCERLEEELKGSFSKEVRIINSDDDDALIWKGVEALRSS